MTLLLCILLHLSLISAPNTYLIQEIDNIEQANLSQVNQIRNDAAAVQQVYDDFNSTTEWITIIDPGEQ